MPSPVLSLALRDKSTVPVGEVELLERRSSAAVTLTSVALFSAVFGDQSRLRICWGGVANPPLSGSHAGPRSGT